MTPVRDTVVVCGAFDNPGSHQVRLLQEASRFGPLTAFVWPDDLVIRLTGSPPKLPLNERLYFLNAIRYLTKAIPAPMPVNPGLIEWPNNCAPSIWVDEASSLNDSRRTYCAQRGIAYQVLPSEKLRGFPEGNLSPASTNRKKVVVTGCYDWFHSGHVRFFEEVSSYGDLYVIVGHDANIRLLKGEGHPLLCQEERRYMTGAVRYVTRALISSGHGWLDADPEIQALKPDIYAVNEDGDKGGKREYCALRGIEYLVLNRTPAPGLPRRSSTVLRGF